MKRIVLGMLASFLVLAGSAADARTLRWAGGTDPGALDPYSRNVTTTLMFLANIYEPLVRHDKTLRLEPGLATAWSQPTPDVWRFTLREGVRFHDGSPFGVDDVLFSYERVRGPG